MQAQWSPRPSSDEIYSGEKRNQVFAIVGIALSFTPAIGPVIGGWVDQLFGWKSCFHVLVGMGLVLLVFSQLKLNETLLKPSKPNLPVFLELFKKMSCDPKILCFAFLIGACNGIIFSYYAEAPFLFIELLKFSPSEYGLLGIIVSSFSILASHLYGRLSSRFKPEQTMVIGTTISFAGSLILVLISSLGWLIPSNGILAWTSFMAAMGLVYLGIGILIPNCLSNALSSYQTYLGTAGSILGATYYILIGLFTALMGMFHSGASTAMPIYFSVLTGSMVVISQYYYRLATKVLASAA